MHEHVQSGIRTLVRSRTNTQYCSGAKYIQNGLLSDSRSSSGGCILCGRVDGDPVTIHKSFNVAPCERKSSMQDYCNTTTLVRSANRTTFKFASFSRVENVFPSLDDSCPKLVSKQSISAIIRMSTFMRAVVRVVCNPSRMSCLLDWEASTRRAYENGEDRTRV